MLGNKTTTPTESAAITAHTVQLIQEFQRIYEPGEIPEALEMLKDTYSSTTEEGPDARQGIIGLVNHLRDLANSIVPATQTA